MKSIDKILDILEIFLNVEDAEMRLSDIAKLSGLNKSTVNRIVSTLVDRSYLSQQEKWGKYSLGSKFLIFSSAIKHRQRIKTLLMPYLSKLNQSIKESVILATWNGDRVFYSEVILSSHLLKIVPDEGEVEAPLYCTAIGKIFLSYRTEPELEQYFNTVSLAAHTKNTITEVNLLKYHLKTVAGENIAYDDEEYLLGVKSVASGIKDGENNVIACIGVSGPSVRLTPDKMTDLAMQVKNCALECSIALGHKDGTAHSH